MSEEQAEVPQEPMTLTDMSSIKFKNPSGTMKRQISKEKDIAEEGDDAIAVLEHTIEPRQLHLSIKPERDIPPPPLFRLREPRQGPALRPRASKRSTMTWPGCR
ncbi:hypothetical protein ACF0H5_023422 [Mactra antiquata]